MSYSREQVDHLVARMAAKAPALRAIRTDHLPPNRAQARPRPTGRHQVILDRHPAKSFTLHLVPEDHPNQPVKRLAQYLSLSIEDARSLFLDFHTLAETNRYGAWPMPDHCLAPAQLEPLSFDHADVIKSDARPYVLDCLRDLVDVLPGVADIEIQAWTEYSHSGTQRRRTYFRFLSGPGVELACIESSTLTFQFRHEVTHDPEHHYHDINEARRRAWLEQLGVSPADLAVVLHLLPMFALSIPVPSIRLTDPATAQAWWQGRALRASA